MPGPSRTLVLVILPVVLLLTGGASRSDPSFPRTPEEAMLAVDQPPATINPPLPRTSPPTHPGAPKSPTLPVFPSEPTMNTPNSIDTTRFVGSGMVERMLVKEAVVNASPEAVFKLWTTPEGIKEFLDVKARVELRVGGRMELLFGADKEPAGQQGSEGCQILSYIPNRMLSFSWNAPPKFPAEREKRTWVVLMFDPVDGSAGGKTRVRLTHLGFGAGENWDGVYGYFDRAWTGVLAKLVEHSNPGGKR